MKKDKNILERTQKVINLYIEQENSLNAIEKHLNLLSKIEGNEESVKNIKTNLETLKKQLPYSFLRGENKREKIECSLQQIINDHKKFEQRYK